MIKSFRHKGLRQFYETGTTKGIQAKHVPKLRRQLARLEVAAGPQDMNVPGWDLHPLKGTLQNHWSVKVSGNWRLTYTFENGDAVLVDYQDYH
jgi:toxin HigB-1